ncbi:hypothetical protein AAFN85_02985 [Mucilaginibacter sp. CAU 1740]|uniref:hypothetical protein n=1 Tax=Mucilaginibacter sp. CAU 1740 TaxID=3140365 RepID=UPI00325B65C1
MHAQQAKAYEVVHYIARSGKFIYSLDYADGYPAASHISIKNGKQPASLLQPVSGAAESNGDFVFRPAKGLTITQVILKALDETSSAPASIKAIAMTGKGRVILNFKVFGT